MTLTLMFGFERAIWISRRPRCINWWNGYSAIFESLLIFLQKALYYYYWACYENKCLSLLFIYSYFRHTITIHYIYNSLHSLLIFQALRVTSIKFVLVISMLCQTEWSWELRTWSHKMNLFDILSTSPHYFCRKWIGGHKWESKSRC